MSMRWLLATIAAIVVAGFLLAYRTTMTKVETDVDIVAVNTLLKTIEGHWPDRLNEVVDSMKQPFAVIDANGVLLYETSNGVFTSINDSIKSRSTIVDVHSHDEYVGKLIIPHDYDRLLQLDRQNLAKVIIVAFSLLAGLAAIYALLLHYSVFKPFEKLRRFASNIAKGNLDVPLTVSPGNPFGAFAESFDMMREELAAAKQSEYAANRSKKELVATLSHDIKTPVASIKALSELMLLQTADEKAIKQLNMIFAKADQINLLVTDMFHATLEEMQQLKVAPVELLSSVIDEMIASINYDDRIRCGPVPACVIVADASRLQQVFDNVLSNAYKYAGTPVTITSRIHEGYLELQLMDYGKGVDPDEIPLLSGKFYRGSNSEGMGGTGLGLYISHYFMKHMEGDLTCRNREDGFTVELKLKLA